MVRELDRLKQLRAEAWEKFNPRLLPSATNNGWPDFAIANANYLKCFKALYPGKEPPYDEIERVSTNYFLWNRYEKKHWEKEAPDWVWGITD
jgi:hypothetical protein